MWTDLTANTSSLPCIVTQADGEAVELDSNRHQEIQVIEEATSLAGRSDVRFEGGTILLDAIDEFSSTDCNEGEGEGIGGEVYADEEVDGDGKGEGEADGDGEIQHCSYPCCLKLFTSRWSLTRHIRTHTGEKPFKCNICGKEFVQKCTLKRHANTHTQEKQWICDSGSCSKRFKLKEYLDVHKRTHVKIDTLPKPSEDEDNLVTDTANTAGSLIDQLRQRLVRMSVRHHEQIVFLQQREAKLFLSLQDCSNVLQETVNLINDRNSGYIPPYMIEASARLSKIVSKHATSHSAASSVNASAAVDIGLPISANANALLDPSNVLLNQSNALLNLANALRRNGSHRLNEMDDDTYKYRVEEDKYRVSNEMEYINSQTVRDSDSAHTIPHLNTTLDRGQINIMNAYRSNNSNNNNNNNNNKYPFSSDTLTSTSTSSKKKTSDIPSSVGILNQHSHHIARLSMKRVHDDVNNNSSNSQNQHHNHHMSHLNQVHRDSYHSSVDFTPNNSNSQLCSVIPRSNSHFARSHYGIVPTPSLSSTSTSSSASSTQSYTVIRSQGVNPALLYPHHQGDVSGINLFRVCSSTNTNASTKTNINSNINASPNVDVRLLHLLSGDQICTENYINSNSSYLPPKIINSNPLFTIPKTGSSTTGVNQGSVDSVFVEKKR